FERVGMQGHLDPPSTLHEALPHDLLPLLYPFLLSLSTCPHKISQQSHSIGAKDPARVHALVFEQKQLIAELNLLGDHLQLLEAEIIQLVEHSREGKILTSIPGIGPQAAAALIATIGTIANFERPAQLKSSFGWVPKVAQS